MTHLLGYDDALDSQTDNCRSNGCTMSTVARGLCSRHYQRWRRTGTIEDTRRTGWIRKSGITPLERLFARTEPHVGPLDTPCWTARGRSTDHYYTIKVGEDKRVKAHRFMYEMTVGSIARGLVVDHLCEVKGCFNPGHLEAVTQSINIKRTYRREDTVADINQPSSRRRVIG